MSVWLYCYSVIVFLLRIIAVKLLWVRLQLIMVSLWNLKAPMQHSLLPSQRHWLWSTLRLLPVIVVTEVPEVTASYVTCGCI